MKKSEIKELFSTAIESKSLCSVLFKYDVNLRLCFPLIVSDKLFLCANEDDFIVDGFSIRRFSDVKKAGIKNDKYSEIIKAENVLGNLQAPQIDVTNWHSAFLSLEDIGCNIIVEKESLVDDECNFAIGKIVKVLRSSVIFKYFDADGIWQDDTYEIPFSQITSVTFASRYVDVYSKYI